MSNKLVNWIAEHEIAEIECIVPDMNGVQRGKVLPAAKFLAGFKDGTLEHECMHVIQFVGIKSDEQQAETLEEIILWLRGEMK